MATGLRHMPSALAHNRMKRVANDAARIDVTVSTFIHINWHYSSYRLKRLVAFYDGKGVSQILYDVTMA